MCRIKWAIFLGVIVFISSVSYGQSSSASGGLPSSEVAQIKANVRQLYSLPYVDATCLFSKVDETGSLIDSQAKKRAFRERQYERIFKPLLSGSLYAEMRESCVSVAANGILDLRINDDSLVTNPQYRNGVVLKVTRPIRIEARQGGGGRAIVYWSEFYGKTAKKAAMSGRTDLLLVRESGRWLIDDAVIAAFDPNLSDDSHAMSKLINESADTFELKPDGVSVLDYRSLPTSCSKDEGCK